MAVVVARPRSSDAETEGELVQLHILVELGDFEGKFDQLEVWRADSEVGPYEERTAAVWLPPRIPKTAKDAPSSPVTGRNVSIVGKTLIVRPLEPGTVEYTFTFTGTDPLTYAQVATQITTNGRGQLRGYVDPDGVFVVESTLPGVYSQIRIVGGDAAPLLELPIEEPDSVASGRDSRLRLSKGLETYAFTDPFSAKTAFYKTRFRNRLTNAVSEFSQAFEVEDEDIGVQAENVIMGQLDLVGIDGKPLPGIEVTIYGSTRVVLTDGKLVAWAPKTKVTDVNGHVEFLLTRGIHATVAISGTNIIRDILVPTDPTVTIFSLFDSTVGTADDHFKVVVPEVIAAEKITL